MRRDAVCHFRTLSAQPAAGLFEILVQTPHHQVDGASVHAAHEASIGVLPQVEQKAGMAVVDVAQHLADLTLPLYELLLFRLIVPTEVAADGLYQI